MSERVILRGSTERLTAGKLLLLVALAIGPVAAPLLAAAATAPRLRAGAVPARVLASQSPASAGQSSVQFEAASVKLNTSAGKVMIQPLPGGRFIATGVTLRQLIRNAYQLEESQVTGGPGWLDTDRFDIVAKAEAGGGADPFQAEKGGGPSRGQLMLRALLDERFKLAVHTELKELPIYALVVARSDGALGPRLQRSARNCDVPDAGGKGAATPSPADRPSCGMKVFPGTILADATTLSQLANSLSALVGRVVLNRTGLEDKFEFTLKWTPDQIPPGYNQKASAIGLPPIETDGPALFTAVREQLGLKFDSQKGPVNVLVIDRAERPTAN